MFLSKELYSSRVYVLSQAQAFIKPTKIFIRSRNIALRPYWAPDPSRFDVDAGLAQLINAKPHVLKMSAL